MINQKPYSFGLALRGFYDDNYFTYPKALRNTLKHDDSFGFDVSPSVAYNLKHDNTTFGISYVYNFRYYFDRERPRDDQSHQANMKLSHAFNEVLSLDIIDSFVIAQEPSILDPSIDPTRTVPARVSGSNVRNLAGIQLNANMAEKGIGGNIGYNNTLFDYEENASTSAVSAVGSRSSVLDRMVHMIKAEGNYQVMPKTTASLEYRFRYDDYTSFDPFYIAAPGTVLPPGAPTTLVGNDKDNWSHFASVGVRQQFNPQLSGSLKVGAQYTQYQVTSWFKDTISPFAEASVRWVYMEGSSAQLNVSHSRIPTDTRLGATATGFVPVSDQEATAVQLSVNHAITAKLTGILQGGYQHSVLGETTRNLTSAEDNLFFAGLTFLYQFNPHIAAELSYMYDHLDSDIALRSFTRNRIFVGTRLSL
jgi:hypothetical protein